MENLADIRWVFALGGALLVITAALGGGIEVRELRIPRLPLSGRFMSVLVGVGLIALAVVVPSESEEVETQYSLTIGIDGNGTTYPRPGMYTYDEDTVVSLVSTPDAGYEFDCWSGGYGTSPTLQITLTDNMSIMAYFKLVGDSDKSTVELVTINEADQGHIVMEQGFYNRKQLTVTVKDSAGTVIVNREVMWTSNAPGIAQIAENGEVTGMGCGATEITATVDGVSCRATIFVQPDWEEMPGGCAEVISVGNETHVWHVGCDNRIWRWPYNGRDWEEMPVGCAIDVSVGSDGTIWHVDCDNKIWRWTDGNWEEIPGWATDISVGNYDLVWHVGWEKSIWKWNDWETEFPWEKIPGEAALNISVGSDGTVWYIGTNNRIFRWSGSVWDSVPGELQQISVGNASNIWGVNSRNQVLRWNGVDWDPAGQIPGGFTQVSVGSDGTVWAVDTEDKIWRGR